MNTGFEHSPKEKKVLKELERRFQNRKAEYIATNLEHSKVTGQRGNDNNKTNTEYSSIQVMKRCKGFDYMK